MRIMMYARDCTTFDAQVVDGVDVSQVNTQNTHTHTHQTSETFLPTIWKAKVRTAMRTNELDE